MQRKPIVLLAMIAVTNAYGGFVEDFESEEPGVWQPPTATARNFAWDRNVNAGPGDEVLISQEYAHTGVNSMTQTRGVNAPSPIVNARLDSSVPGGMSFWYLTTNNSVTDWWGAYEAWGAQGDYMFNVWIDRIQTSTNGNVVLESSEGLDVIATGMGTGQWYKIEIDPNFEAQYVTVAVRDDLGNIVGLPVIGGFVNNSPKIGAFYSYHGTSVTPVTFYDDFFLIPEPAGLTFLALSATGILVRRRRRHAHQTGARVVTTGT